MNTRPLRAYDIGDDYDDANHRDRTLRALEGQVTPPDSAEPRQDGDDTGDLFLRIAHEDSSRRVPDENTAHGDSQSVVVSR
jgi:hypothetical protein